MSARVPNITAVTMMMMWVLEAEEPEEDVAEDVVEDDVALLVDGDVVVSWAITEIRTLPGYWGTL